MIAIQWILGQTYGMIVAGRTERDIREELIHRHAVLGDLRFQAFQTELRGEIILDVLYGSEKVSHRTCRSRFVGFLAFDENMREFVLTIDRRQIGHTEDEFRLIMRSFGLILRTTLLI